MLFSRRKRATAVEPEAPAASGHSNGAAPDVGLDEAPTVEVPPVFTDPLDATPDGGDLGHRGPHGAGSGAGRRTIRGRSPGGSGGDAAGARRRDR